MRRFAAGAAVLAAAAAAGCGGDGPQATFTREADAACARWGIAVKVRSSPPTIRSAQTDTRLLRLRLTRRITALERIKQPRGDEEQIGRWLEQLHANAAALRSIEVALARGRLEAARRPQAEYGGGDLRARELARGLGLDRCAAG